MPNDEIQEDVTLENDVEVEETEEETETSEDTEDETTEEKDWKAEAKKWEAIAKRKAKKVEKSETEVGATAPAYDEELIEITYRNFLGNIGLESKSVQDEAIQLAKKMGKKVSEIQSDPAIMAVLKAKEEIARTNKATSKGTGGAAVKKKGADWYANQVKSGKSISEDDIAGKSAMDILKAL